jgi:transmembrane sensor
MDHIMASQDNPQLQIEAEAEDWLIELSGRDAEADEEGSERHAAFFRWASQSPDHLRAFVEIAAVFDSLDAIDADRRIDVRALLNDPSADVIPLHAINPLHRNPDPSAQLTFPEKSSSPTLLLDEGEGGREGRMRKIAGRGKNVWLASAAAVVATAIGASLFLPSFVGRTYETAVGEQRTLTLDDGSVLHLNTHSRVRVRLSHAVRQIDLLEGEAMFEVEHDAKRPFLVSTGSATVRAVGTQFNVYRHPDASTTVAVIEGVVQITANPHPLASRAPSPLGGEGPREDASGLLHRVQKVSAKVTDEESPGGARGEDLSRQGGEFLRAGEEASIAAGLVVRQAKVDVAGAVAWRSGELSFRDTRLADVAAEFNRYNKVQIRVDGEIVRERRLTGVFGAEHPQSVILYLAKDESLTVMPEGNTWVIRAR